MHGFEQLEVPLVPVEPVEVVVVAEVPVVEVVPLELEVLVEVGVPVVPEEVPLRQAQMPPLPQVAGAQSESTWQGLAESQKPEAALQVLLPSSQQPLWQSCGPWQAPQMGSRPRPVVPPEELVAVVVEVLEVVVVAVVEEVLPGPVVPVEGPEVVPDELGEPLVEVVVERPVVPDPGPLVEVVPDAALVPVVVLEAGRMLQRLSAGSQ